MRLSSRATYRTALAWTAMVSTVYGQALDSIPPCYQDCIENSGDFTCNGIDIPCICRLSNGNFLTDVITCIKSSCDSSLDTNNLLEPLQVGCRLVGVPISPAAIANAQDIGSMSDSPTSTRGRLTVTSTFASAGTTFVVAAPLSVTSGIFGVQTSTGRLITSTATRSSPSRSRGGAAGDSRTSDGDSATSTGSSPSETDTGEASSSATESSASDTSTSEASVTMTSTSSAAATSSSASDTGPGTSSGTPQATSNGSPFSNDGHLARRRCCDWLQVGVGILAGLVWL